MQYTLGLCLRALQSQHMLLWRERAVSLTKKKKKNTMPIRDVLDPQQARLTPAHPDPNPHSAHLRSVYTQHPKHTPHEQCLASL